MFVELIQEKKLIGFRNIILCSYMPIQFCKHYEGRNQRKEPEKTQSFQLIAELNLIFLKMFKAFFLTKKKKSMKLINSHCESTKQRFYI